VLFHIEGASPKRAVLYVLGGEGKLLQVCSDWPDAESGRAELGRGMARGLADQVRIRTG
jgi:hypothetical protein